MGSQRHLFDIPADVAHFDTAALGPLLRRSVAEGQAGLALRGQPWRVEKAAWFAPPDERRRLLATILGATADCIALVPSVSYGAAVAAANLRGRTGAILCLPEEFPSTANTWLRLAGCTGMSLRHVHRLEGATWTESVLAALDESIGIVCAPTVRWTDGAMLDLPRIAARARDCGASLVVDATQSLGVLPFDLAAVRPDFLFAAGYKWLLGPYGLSYLYVDPQHHEGRPLEETWAGRQGAEDFARLAEPKGAYRAGARRFDAGEQAAFELGPAAEVALRQILDWSVEAVSHRLGRITAEIGELAQAADFEVARPQERAPHFICLRLPEQLDDPLDRLRAAGVHASRRGRLLRLAPHVHVDEPDLRRLAQALGGLAPTRAQGRRGC